MTVAPHAVGQIVFSRSDEITNRVTVTPVGQAASSYPVPHVALQNEGIPFVDLQAYNVPSTYTQGRRRCVKQEFPI